MHSLHIDLKIVPHLGHNCFFHVPCNSSFTKIITFNAIQSELLAAVLHKQHTHTHTHTYVKSKAIPVQSWTGPEGSKRSEAPRFQDSQHMKVVRLSTISTSHLYPQEIFLVLISVRGWVDPQAIVWREGLCQWKVMMTPCGIERMALQFVAQCAPYTHTHTHTHTHIYMKVNFGHVENSVHRNKEIVNFLWHPFLGNWHKIYISRGFRSSLVWCCFVEWVFPISKKCQEPPTKWQSFTSQMTWMLNHTTVRTANLTSYNLCLPFMNPQNLRFSSIENEVIWKGFKVICALQGCCKNNLAVSKDDYFRACRVSIIFLVFLVPRRFHHQILH